MWMSLFLSELDLEQDGPVELYIQQGANSLTKNSKQHALAKHIITISCHHHIQEKVADGEIVVKDIQTMVS